MNPGYEPGGEPLDFRGLAAALRREIWLIVAAIVVATVAEWLHLRRTPREYRATAVVRLTDTRRAIAGGFADSSSQAIGGAQVDPIWSEIEVLLSRSNGAAIADRHPLGLRVVLAGVSAGDLRDVSLRPDAPPMVVTLRFGSGTVAVESPYGRAQVPLGSPVTAGPLRLVVLRSPPSAKATLTVRSQDDAVDVLRAKLFAKARGQTSVVDVSFTGPDPALAREIVDTAVTVFEQNSAVDARAQSRRRREFIAEQLRETDSTLLLAQDRLSAYRSRNHVMSSEGVVTARVSGLLAQDTQREDLRAQRLVLQSLLDTLSTANARGKRRALRALAASPRFVENPAVQGLFGQLLALETTRDSLTTGRWSSAPTSPDVLQLDTLIASTQANLAEAAYGSVRSLDARITALDTVRARAASALNALPTVEAGEARLREQVRSTEALANKLRDDYLGARIAEAVQPGNVEVIDLAPTPGAPIGPRRALQLLAAALAGLVLGVGLVLMRARSSPVIRRSSEIEDLVELPLLGSIPPIDARSLLGRVVHVIRDARARLPAPLRPHGAARSRAVPLLTLGVASPAAEAFRVVRTNLTFTASPIAPRSIIVASPSPREGRTTTAANLAITFAQQGTPVLLVDADLRRPALHQAFGVARAPGLTDLVLGGARLPVADAVRRTALDHLDLLPAGVALPNPAVVLGSAGLRELIARMLQAYDIVVFDSPAVQMTADAVILARNCDGVMLVLRVGTTPVAIAREAVDRFTRTGAHVLGAVLNDPDGRARTPAPYYEDSTADAEPHAVTTG